MSAVHEFVTPIPVDTEQGPGYALFVEVDNHVQYWTIVLTESRAFMTLPQDQIFAACSYTHGRGITHEKMREILKNAKARNARD